MTLNELYDSYAIAHRKGDRVFLIEEDLVEGEVDLISMFASRTCIGGDKCINTDPAHGISDCYTKEQLVFKREIEPFLPEARRKLREWYDSGKLTDKWTERDVWDFALLLSRTFSLNQIEPIPF